jgi:hypothetical protein
MNTIVHRLKGVGEQVKSIFTRVTLGTVSPPARAGRAQSSVRPTAPEAYGNGRPQARLGMTPRVDAVASCGREIGAA